MSRPLPPRHSQCHNCLQLHWGPCPYPQRQCWYCGQIGHIQRYCPNKSETTDGDIPGSRTWCRNLGLGHVPRLRNEIIGTLKDYPGATIYLNNEVIYQGVQAHFYRPGLWQMSPRGRDLVRYNENDRQARQRQRSRSPVRELVRRRDRSPLVRYSESPEPHVRVRCEENREYRHLDVVMREEMRPSQLLMKSPGRPNLSSTLTSPISRVRISTPIPTRPRLMNPPLRPALAPRSHNQQQRQRLVSQLDPYAILEVPPNLPRHRYLDAYEQAVYEIKIERDAEINDGSATYAQRVQWEDKLRLLNEARKMLFGGSASDQGDLENGEI